MTPAVRYLLAAAVCTTVAGIAPALVARQTRDVTQSPRSAAETAQLSGRVLDAPVEGKPVRRAVVTLAGTEVPAGRSAITDDDGRFAFAALSPGDYTVRASRPGFLGGAYGASRPGRPGTPIALAPGQHVTDVTVVLTHGSAVEGLLRDTAGDPAPGMRVEAIRLTRTTLGERGERVGVAFTDDRGVFRIFGLPAGDYVFVATPAVIVGGMGEIGAPSEADVDALFADMSRRAGGAAPMPTPMPSRPGRTDTPAASPVRRGYSTPATYYPGVVSSGDAVRLTLGHNDERVGVDFPMKLSTAATVTGAVVSASGQPLPRILVQIRAFGPELPVAGGSLSGGPSVTSNRDDGSFRIANVPPGRYRIVARSLGAPGSPTGAIASGGALPQPGADGGPVLWAETDVQVTGDDLTGITLTLQPAPGLSGLLTFESTSRKPASSSVRVQLEPAALPDEPSNGLTTPLTTQVRADGTFEFPAVVPGAYRMTAAGPPGFWARSAVLASRDLLDELVLVRHDSLAGIVLTMSDRRTAIIGSLSTPAGQAASGYFVVALPADRALWRWPSRRIVSTRPATNGAFELQDLAPGEYRVGVLTDLEPADLGDPSFLETLATMGVTVPVAAGERRIQHLRIGK